MSSVAQTNPPKPKFHLLAELFPEIEKGTPAYEQFKADIKANGVREPIWTRKLPDGTIQILDGKNRRNVADELGVPCPSREYTGDEAGMLDFVVSQNLHRRQLDASQRAVVAARIAKMRQGARTDLQPKPNLAEVSIEAAAQRMNVSTGSVKNAKKVIAKAVPEITKAVEQGKLKVSAAAVVSDHSADVQHQAAIKIAAGAKGSDVVKALPPSPAKAKASAPAPVKLSKEQKKAQEKAKDVWASLYLRLEEGWADDHDGEDLWDYDASEFWPLLDSNKREEVLHVAKMLMPWLGGIIHQAEGAKADSKPKLVTKPAHVQ